MAASAHLKPIRFGTLEVSFQRRPDGCIIATPRSAIGSYAERFSEMIDRNAQSAPERVAFAERDGGGTWRTVSWAALREDARRIGSALLNRRLSAERPVALLSGNSVDHARLAVAAHYVGVPTVPISPAYSLVSRDFGKLKHCIGLTTPGLVFVEDGESFAAALGSLPAEIEIVFARRPPAGRRGIALAELAACTERADIDDVRRAVEPDTILKFLLTSGSTGLPKAVINTHRMLAANQAMILQTLRFLDEAPPILVDWLPWNHTFGGNHNFGLVCFNAGSLYIDEGRPTPDLIGATARNLAEISPTVYFNVPKGFESLLPFLRADAGLRRNLYSRLQAFFFAGAGLSAHVWRELDRIGAEETGHSVPILTGLGATETAPFSLSANPQTSRSGHVGLPVPGNTLKLVPSGNRYEARIKGDNITPGYWRQPELTAAAFDAEGYYCYGDALRPADPEDLNKGFDFDGRIAEDFKLATGTWVNVGPLKARLIAALAPFARDAVIAGRDRDHPTAIIIPDVEACRAAFPEVPATSPLAVLLAHPGLRQAAADKLRQVATGATGSSTRIDRIVFLAEPPSIDRGEITDKGSINQNAVLTHRAELIEALYADPADPRTLAAESALPLASNAG
jgi:feruloyl-CoA synthase